MSNESRTLWLCSIKNRAGINLLFAVLKNYKITRYCKVLVENGRLYTIN